MQRLTPAKRAWAFFFLVSCVTYFYGLGNFPLIGADEPRYAQVAREMFTRGDMVTPTLGGHTWFEKPALPYWFMMAGFQLFGVSERAARTGFALLGLFTVLTVYWLGRRVELRAGDELRWLGLASGVAAGSSAGLIFFSAVVNYDTPLTAATTLALACFLVSELEEVKRRRLLLIAGFYAGVGAGLLSKGLIGIIIPVGVVTAYFALRREWPRLEIMKSVLWGVPLALAVASVWYAPVINRHGWTFVDEFFIQHHFARYTSNKYHHPQPFYFYIPIIALFVLPWTPYMVEALAGARRWSWRADDAATKFRVFALVWLIVPVLFFSASGSKLPGYVLPALPGAALLIGERLARRLRGEGSIISMRASGALAVLLAVASVMFLLREGSSSMTCALMGALPLAAGGLVALLCARKGWLALVALVCVMFMMTIVNMQCGAREMARHNSVAHALETAAARGYGNAPVYQLFTVDRTAEYYAAGRLAYGPDGEPLSFEGGVQVLEAARATGGTVLVIVPVQFIEELTTYKAVEAEVIDNYGELALVAVRAR